MVSGGQLSKSSSSSWNTHSLFVFSVMMSLCKPKWIVLLNNDKARSLAERSLMRFYDGKPLKKCMTSQEKAIRRQLIILVEARRGTLASRNPRKNLKNPIVLLDLAEKIELRTRLPKRTVTNRKAPSTIRPNHFGFFFTKRCEDRRTFWYFCDMTSPLLKRLLLVIILRSVLS
jgi:hypothetical protein